ncbi:MAG TPA: carboxypeptidase-like regulatory domain-containing protein, partial [Sphingobacteriaceae bacterium]
MKRTSVLAAGLLFLLTVVSFIRSDDPLKNMLDKLEKFRSDYPQEKVHLHLDKPYYAIGDNIWFKAYVVNGARNQLSALSKILYVELINEKDSVKQSARVHLRAGQAWGDFHLADSLKEGNYRIRAYTTWMRNFGEDFFFDKTISVGNSLSNDYLTDVSYSFSGAGNSEKVLAAIKYLDLEGKPVANKEVSYSVQLDFRQVAAGKTTTDATGKALVSFVNNQPWLLKSGKISTRVKIDDQTSFSKIVPIKSTSSNVSVQFFPEGGDLVEGIRSKIAFKAVGADGLGVDVDGFVSDNANEKIAEFKSEYGGMGTFALKPEAGRTYKAIVTLKDGSKKTLPLPKALKSGYTLSAAHTDKDNILIRVGLSPELVGKGEVTIIGHTNGIANFVSKTKVTNTVLSASVPKTKFAGGILHLTLFNPANEPVSERLMFIRKESGLKVGITSDKTEYLKREKARLSIDARDTGGGPEVGSFSVAVVDESKVPFDDIYENTILSNLLLSSDIKGFVETPNYYFTAVDDKKDRELDNLLLTQGWRRFTWKSILANALPLLSFNPEKEIGISGTVTDNRGRPVAGGKVTLLSSAGDVLVQDTLTDQNGRFAFNKLIFRDSTKFVVQARNARDRKNVDVNLDMIPPQLVTRNKNAPEVEINVNNTMLGYLKNSRNQYNDLRRFGLATRSIVLKEVKIVEKKQQARNSSNLNGSGVADAVLDESHFASCVSLDQCLQGRVAGLVIQDGIAYSARSMYSSFQGLVPMQLVLDGTYVTPDYLRLISPRDVESVEVLKSASNTAIYGIRGGGGILIITTKRGKQNLGYSSYAAG